MMVKLSLHVGQNGRKRLTFGIPYNEYVTVIPNVSTKLVSFSYIATNQFFHRIV